MAVDVWGVETWMNGLGIRRKVVACGDGDVLAWWEVIGSWYVRM